MKTLRASAIAGVGALALAATMALPAQAFHGGHMGGGHFGGGGFGRFHGGGGFGHGFHGHHGRGFVGFYPYYGGYDGYYDGYYDDDDSYCYWRHGRRWCRY